jgi:O-acetyl-ADP-ribose deacetylase (regulator of RNase III)
MKVQTGNIVGAVKSGVILHQVNCQGVMGSGVAAALRAQYPGVFDDYSKFIEDNRSAEDIWLDGANLLGKIVVSKVSDTLDIVSMFGQQHYGRDGRRYTSYDALDSCLKQVGNLYESENIHFPQFGAGLGGGNWNVIASLIEQHLGCDCKLWVLP